MRLHGTILLTFILAMASCTKRQEALPYVGNPCGTDTTALNVAVLPTLSCLPVYYAQRMGMFDSAGVNVQLWRYRAQMDVDTSVLRGHVQVAMSDPFRALRLQSDTLSVAPLLAIDEPLSMIALKGKRIKHMQQMKEKMVAISRLSCTDYWCQRMITDSDIELSLIFRPQINDIFLRADMLRNGLIDAAMLPEPYVTWATQEGHRRINRTKTPSLCNALWIMPHRKDKKSTHETKSILFAKVYRMAIERMNSDVNRDTVKAILKVEYGLPPLLADTIKLPPLPTPRAITAQEVDTAAEWLRQQNRLPPIHSTQDFLSKQPE